MSNGKLKEKGDSPKKLHAMPPSASVNSLWAIGGGKGGIGKSFVSSSMAIALAKIGKTVTLVDLDLGAANLHTCLGIKIPQASLSDFIHGRTNDLRQLSVETELPGMRFISGFHDSLNVADISTPERQRLVNALGQINSQYVILDLGAGTSETTLDFFLAAHQKIVTVTPEPTSIENAYRFMKASFYRRLRLAEDELGISNLLDSAMDSRNTLGIRSPADLVRHVTQANPEAGERLESRISDYRVQILLNQVRTRNDVELGHSMKSVCHKYFGIEANYLGYIDHDNAVWQSLRKKRPFLLEHPYSSLVGQFVGITKNLLNPQAVRAVI